VQCSPEWVPPQRKVFEKQPSEGVGFTQMCGGDGFSAGSDPFLLGSAELHPESTFPAGAILGATVQSIAFTEDSRVVQRVLQNLIGDDSYSSVRLVPAVVIQHSSHPNAFARATQKQVVITTAMLDAFRNTSEVAFVLAHELSHLILEHSNATDYAAEYEADRLAISMLKASGYNSCSGVSLLARLGQRSPGHARAVSGRVEALKNLLRGCNVVAGEDRLNVAQSVG
jgi:predicted Zn-dependent protease